MAHALINGRNVTPAGLRAESRRAAVRFNLRTEITFCWLDHGFSRHGKVRTRDISTQGVYVLCSTSPLIGTTVALNIEIPALPGRSKFLRIKIEGRVVRTESAGATGERCGFAVKNDRITAAAD